MAQSLGRRARHRLPHGHDVSDAGQAARASVRPQGSDQPDPRCGNRFRRRRSTCAPRSTSEKKISTNIFQQRSSTTWFASARKPDRQDRDGELLSFSRRRQTADRRRHPPEHVVSGFVLRVSALCVRRDRPNAAALVFRRRPHEQLPDSLLRLPVAAPADVCYRLAAWSARVGD